MIADILAKTVTIPPVTWFTLNVIAPIDRYLMLLTKGRFCLTGRTIILVNTVGAKSGKARPVTLPCLMKDDVIVLIASAGGRPKHPGWYYNLRANPIVTVSGNIEHKKYEASEAKGKEYEEFWQWTLEQWGGFASYQQRAWPRKIPVMLLKPV